MSISSVSLSHYTTLLGSDMASENINTVEQQLQEAQEEITTGNQINQPSDNPGGSATVLQLQKSLDSQNQYLTNVQQSQSQLGEVDSSLSSLTTIVQQAQTIASQDVGSTITPAQRQADATVVQTLYNQAMSIANTQFEGSYIFGGTKSNQQPFVPVSGGVQFVGSNTVLQNTVSANTQVPFQVSAQSVFGATSSQVAGATDLTPALTPATRISDLRGATGTGVQLGEIQIGNGATTAQVNLAGADNIQDVINDINAAGVGGITASISGNHLVLSGGASDNISVSEVGGGSTAASLGILHANPAGAGVAVTGASAQPNVTDLTPLSALNDGAGIDTTHGLIITNGTKSATVNFSSDTTVDDLLNTIGAAGVNVQAQINSAGNGINLVNTVQGTQMTVAENGGTTAADLGVRSYSPSTTLSSLNNGQGLTLATSGPDFQVTASNGSSFSVSLAGATTVQDVINDINSASAGTVSASFAATGNGIVLTDNTGGSGTFAVSALNASEAASQLGLTNAASGNVIDGGDVAPVAAQGLFSNLANLQKALQNDDSAGITQAAQGLASAQQQIVVVRGQAGAQVQELQNLQSTLTTQSTSTQSLMAQIQGADLPSVISRFTTLQTSLEASLQVTARTMSLSLLDFIQ